MPPKNIKRQTAESRCGYYIRGAKASWQRRHTRLTFGPEIGNSIRGFHQQKTRPKGRASFSQISVCTKLPLRRLPRAVLCVLENGPRAGGKSRDRDESESKSSDRHKLLHSTSPGLIRISCHTRKETTNLQGYSGDRRSLPEFEITSYEH
jgi:hypothetical protein